MKGVTTWLLVQGFGCHRRLSEEVGRSNENEHFCFYFQNIGLLTDKWNIKKASFSISSRESIAEKSKGEQFWVTAMPRAQGAGEGKDCCVEEKGQWMRWKECSTLGIWKGVLVLVVVRSKWSWERRADKLRREGMFILAVALNVEKDGKNKF